MSPGIVGLRQETIITATRRAIEDRQLYSCLLCNAVSQIMDACNVDLDSLKPGGEHYELAKDTYHELAEGRIYSFPGGGENLFFSVFDEGTLICRRIFNYKKRRDCWLDILKLLKRNMCVFIFLQVINHL